MRARTPSLGVSQDKVGRNIKEDLICIVAGEVRGLLVRRASKLLPHSSLNPMRCSPAVGPEASLTQVSFSSFRIDFIRGEGGKDSLWDQSPEHRIDEFQEEIISRPITTQPKLKTVPLVRQKGTLGNWHLARELTQNHSVAAQRCWRGVSETVSTGRKVQQFTGIASLTR